MTTDVVVVGVHGHGRSHLRRILAQPSDRIRLIGVCDPRPPVEDQLRVRVRASASEPAGGDLAGVIACPSLSELLEVARPDVTIVCTPIHKHVDLALEAMRAGSDVLLEKPPAATMADHQRLMAGVAETGRRCQVGFQSLGSLALPALDALIADGTIGDVRGIGGAGTWVRDASYYARSRWAGHRVLDGVPVGDGALTNPFAHVMATALRIDGSEHPDQVEAVHVELYHAHAIEADDTAAVRVTTAKGTTITVAVTLCAASSADPYLIVHGTEGRATLWYTRDELRIEASGTVTTSHHARTDLLDNLVAHATEPGVALLVPPERTGAFMQVMEAVRLAPDPAAIPRECLQVHDPGSAERRIVWGIDDAVHASAERLRLFSELDLPWTVPAQSHGASR